MVTAQMGPGAIPVYTSGEILIVEPQDADDPMANEYKGRRCQLIRYAGTDYAFVKFSRKGRRCCFRVGDLRRE